MREIARWNGERDCWETEEVDLLSGLPVVFMETWPASVTTRNNVLYELPTSVPHTGGTGSSSSQPDAMLRTPCAAEAEGGPLHPDVAKERWQTLRLTGQILALTGDLLPTPVAQPSGNKPADHLRKKPGRTVVTGLAIIVENGLLETGGKLLKTPTAQLAINDGSQHPDKRKAGGHGPTLADEVEHLLPTPKAVDADFGMPRTSGRPPEKSTHLMTRMEYTKPDSSWGPYASAIDRWEHLMGRPAPDPTEAGPKGGRRLASRFVEWMMGCADGWVTDVGLKRSQELKALGNGVVTQQALYALGLMRGGL